MTEQQKRYIEDNVELIDNSTWDEFFKYAPTGTGGVLYEAGIDFLEEMNSVAELAFCGSNIQTIDIPHCVESIESEAFYDCQSLTSVVIPNSVTSIYYSAFKSCRSLKSIVIPDSVTTIGYYAFSDCTRLENVTIGNSIKSIVRDLFSNCKSLTSLTIPDSVTKIEEEAFWGCMSLTTVSIPNSVKQIGRAAFQNCGNINIDYTGTIAEWKTLIGNNSRVFKYTTYTCTCIDGVVNKLR